MFEIGSSLREARERQKLELSAIERDTRIRPKFLRALEDEQFDRLPAPAYARGFLRTYADYLGLDAQRFVDEYNAHFAPAEEPQAAVPVRIRRPGRLRRRLLVVLPVALAVGLVAWGFSLGGNHHHRAVPRRHHESPTGSTHGDAEAGPRADRARGHTRSMLAFGAPRLGHREARIRADARTRPDSRLFRAAPLDPHRRALESRRNPERPTRPVAQLDRKRGRDAARPSGCMSAASWAAGASPCSSVVRSGRRPPPE